MTIDPTRFTDWTHVRVGDIIERKGKRYEILKMTWDGDYDEIEGVEFTMRGEDGIERTGRPRDPFAPVRILERPPAEVAAVAQATGVEPFGVVEVLARIQLGATPIAERVTGGIWSCPSSTELDADPAALAAHLLFFHGGAPEHTALDALHGRWQHEGQHGPTIDHTHV